MKNKFFKRGTGAGILLAAMVCAACGAEETDWAVMNLAASDVFLQETIWQETSVYDTAETAVLEVKAAVQEAEDATKEAVAQKEESEPEGSFTVTYQGQRANNDIELRHCECVYDAEDIQIYAKYLYWLSVPETFPYNQYVLYIRTPQEELQLYPVRDFLVDEEHGFLYTKIAGDDGFERVQRMSFTEKNGHMLDSVQELFNAEQAEKMLCSAYDGKMGNGEDGVPASFSNITVELIGVRTDGGEILETEMYKDRTELLETGVGTDRLGVLKGEIGGIETVTGKRYYADWEIDVDDGAMVAELCVLKQYDPVKDKEIFADCNRIFDQIEQGDWSHVKPIEKQYLWGMSSEKWIRMDVNGDGMPELIDGWVIEELEDYEGEEKVAVFSIFAYQDGMAEMVYLDENDGMEFLFITAGGELVYEWGISGGPTTSVFRRCTFDLKWNREYLDTLVRYRFPEVLDEDESLEKEREYYRTYYPDTYGVGGSGVYCLRERRKTEEELRHNEDGQYTVKEYLTEDEFLKMYEEWTGWDFYKAQYMY